MVESDQLTLYEEFFIKGGLAYPVGEDGKPNYGTVTIGPRELKIVNVDVAIIDGKLVESLELENGQFLRGREITIFS